MIDEYFRPFVARVYVYNQGLTPSPATGYRRRDLRECWTGAGAAGCDTSEPDWFVT
jgi:hypothetical protein